MPLSHTPVSLVVVWADGPAFVHVQEIVPAGFKNHQTLDRDLGSSGRSSPENRISLTLIGPISQKQFEATALPFLKALYNAALRLTGGSTADASDLVQETYLRAYRTFENFVPGTNCKAWLFTILYSVFVNHRKRDRRAAFPPTEELEQRYHEAAAASGALVADTAPPLPDERWGPEVDRAFRVLPEPLRAVVLLVDVEQLSYEEIAAALGWPIGTVRSRLFRARKQLFAALQAYAREIGYLKNSEGTK